MAIRGGRSSHLPVYLRRLEGLTPRDYEEDRHSKYENESFIGTAGTM